MCHLNKPKHRNRIRKAMPSLTDLMQAEMSKNTVQIPPILVWAVVILETSPVHRTTLNRTGLRAIQTTGKLNPLLILPIIQANRTTRILMQTILSVVVKMSMLHLVTTINTTNNLIQMPTLRGHCIKRITMFRPMFTTITDTRAIAKTIMVAAVVVEKVTGKVITNLVMPPPMITAMVKNGTTTSNMIKGTNIINRNPKRSTTRFTRTTRISKVPPRAFTMNHHGISLHQLQVKLTPAILFTTPQHTHWPTKLHTRRRNHTTRVKLWSTRPLPIVT